MNQFILRNRDSKFLIFWEPTLLHLRDGQDVEDASAVQGRIGGGGGLRLGYHRPSHRRRIGRGGDGPDDVGILDILVLKRGE